MASYFGTTPSSAPIFDPGSIVTISTSTSLTNASAGKSFLLNTPATYTVTLPQLSSLALGSEFKFWHNNTTGTVTISVFAGDTITQQGSAATTLTMNPGDIVSLRYVAVSTPWVITYTNKEWTAAQGSNDTTPASTAFVINEFGKHKNYLINANFDIWQRSLSGSLNNTYYSDRWQQSFSGTGITSSRQAFTLGQTQVPNEPTYFHRSVVATSAGTGNYAFITQKVEGVRSLAGKTCTLSFYAKADAAKNMAIEFTQFFGTGGSPSTAVNSIGVNTVALTTAWQKYSFTVTVPSLTGKTLGTGSNDYLQLIYWFDAGSTLNARTNSLGQQSGTFDISQPQLEEGSVATQFDARPFTTEFILCKRYYEKSYDIDVFPGTANVGGYITGVGGGSGTRALGNIMFSVAKRAPGTLSFWDYAGTSGQFSQYFNGSWANSAGSVIPVNSNLNGVSIYRGADSVGWATQYVIEAEL